jgi:hypothetical protein
VATVILVARSADRDPDALNLSRLAKHVPCEPVLIVVNAKARLRAHLDQVAIIGRPIFKAFDVA